MNEQLIKKLESISNTLRKDFAMYGAYEVIQEAIQALTSVKSELKKPIWVNVEDREPTIGANYYVEIYEEDNLCTKYICEWAEFKNDEYKYYDWDLSELPIGEDAKVVMWLDESVTL